MKTCNKFKYIFLLLCFVCLFIFNSGCGLDVFYVMPTPITIVHTPSYDSSDFSERYFSFFTNENVTSNSGFSFKGTDIYYRIFDSSSQMNSEVSSLVSLSNNESTSNTAASKMIETYNFNKLRISGCYDEPLIPYTGENKQIYVRLSDYQSIELYSARILEGGENGTYVNSSTTKTIPVRNVNRTSFNFGRSGSNDKAPAQGDDDVDYTSGPTNHKWYVAMFAVAVGYDYTYTNYYSNILYLGAVTIDASATDN